MIQSREIKSFIFGQYFSDGLRISLGVLLPSLLFNFLGELALGITISLGALCVSLADNPGPISHKRNGMLFCNLFIFFTAGLTGLLNEYPFLIAAEILLLCFFFSMFSVYGNRASAIGTAALLVMILSISPQRTATGPWEHAFYILNGGIWYMLLSLLVTRIRPYRLAQQALGECIKEVSSYVRLKANFYDTESDFEKNYHKLISEQVLIHQQQDALREILFKSRMMRKDSTSTGRLLILVFVDVVDLFEQTMATYYDYKEIRSIYGKTGVLDEFKKIINKLADELGNLSYSITKNDHRVKFHDFKGDLENLKITIDKVEIEHGLNNLVLKKILVNVRSMIDRTQKIYTYLNPQILAKEKIRSERDLSKFVTHQDFDLKILKDNLTLNSSIFRHALRVSIVCLIGYYISNLFPVGHHSYWILLTILVILKPGFSLTKQRNFERLIGTLAGGLAGAMILIYIHDETILFLLLLLFMVASYSFQRLNYVTSVLFMTPYILILFSFLGENNLTIAKERILDTVIGSSIALISSYLILPSWEYHQLKKTIIQVLVANYNYLLKVADSLNAKSWDVTSYKLARKDVYVSSANIGSAFQRMLSEPKSKQRNVKDLHKFVVLNHILSSYIATLISNLQVPEIKDLNVKHVKSLRKSIYTLCETIKIFDSQENKTLREVELPDLMPYPENSEGPDSKLLEEQLQFLNNLVKDINKIAEKLSV